MGQQISDCCATQGFVSEQPDKLPQDAKTRMLNYWAYNKINTTAGDDESDDGSEEEEEDEVNPEAEGYKHTELKETESPHPFTPGGGSDNNYNDIHIPYTLQPPPYKQKFNNTIPNKINDSQIKNNIHLIKQNQNLNQMTRSLSSPINTNKLQENNEEFIAKYGSYFTNSTNLSPPIHPKPPTISTQEITNTNTQTIDISDSLYDDDMSPISLQSTKKKNEPSAPILIPQKSPIFQQKSGSFQHDHEYHNNNDSCQNVSSCKAIKRIIRALKWYQLSDNDNNNKNKRDSILLNKILGIGYDKYLLDDYQHILNHHLIQCMIDITDNEYKLICTEINKQIEPCDIKRCIGYQRFQEIVKKDLSQCPQHVFVVDFMDLIHCYLMHNQYL